MRDLPDPEPGPGEVVLEVAAAGLNRADLLQRQGFYPPPPGASDVLGMECSGTVAALGDGVEGWAVGDQACALLSAGAYATHVAVPVGQLMPVPDGVDLVAAAALPEVACTVWSKVFMVAALQPDEVLLVHGGAGGIGSFAIQLATQLGARVFTTAGTAEKRDFCLSLGAEVAIDYRDEDFVEVVKERTDGAGADVILDNMGGVVPRPERRRPGDRGPAGRHRHAGRHQGRARPRCADAQARRHHRRHAAGPAGRGEGRHLRFGGRARLAAGRRRQGARDRRHHPAARRRTAARTS